MRSGVQRARLTESPAVRWAVIAVVLSFIVLFLVVPLVAVFAQAFMCDTIRLRRAAEGPSRKPTANRTPLVCQYFVVKTAMRSGVGANSGMALIRRSTGG